MNSDEAQTSARCRTRSTGLPSTSPGSHNAQMVRVSRTWKRRSMPRPIHNQATLRDNNGCGCIVILAVPSTPHQPAHKLCMDLSTGDASLASPIPTIISTHLEKTKQGLWIVCQSHLTFTLKITRVSQVARCWSLPYHSISRTTANPWTC